jgi:uncharacterized MAPEG superfamily protein
MEGKIRVTDMPRDVKISIKNLLPRAHSSCVENLEIYSLFLRIILVSLVGIRYYSRHSKSCITLITFGFSDVT